MWDQKEVERGWHHDQEGGEVGQTEGREVVRRKGRKRKESRRRSWQTHCCLVQAKS